jgi:hypothetical protein
MRQLAELLRYNRAYTLVLAILWVLLAIYIFITHDPLGYVILALVTIFVGLPALVLYLGNRSRASRRNDSAESDERPGSDGASGIH